MKVLFINKFDEHKIEKMSFRPMIGDIVLNFDVSPHYKVDSILLFPQIGDNSFREFCQVQNIELICYVD